MLKYVFITTRLSTQHNTTQLTQGHRRLLAIADVSCDVGGSVECLSRTTTVESPFLYHKPLAPGAGAEEALEMDGEGVSDVDVFVGWLIDYGVDAWGCVYTLRRRTLALRYL